MVRLLVERYPSIHSFDLSGVFPSDDGGRNYSLRMTGCSFEFLSQFTRSQVQSFSVDNVLSELSESDKGKRYGAGSKVRN